VALATEAIQQVGTKQADFICFPECYVPGYRAKDKQIPQPDLQFLDRAWDEIAQASAQAMVSTILGTERVSNGSLLVSALVISREGRIEGFQDKVQIDPCEETTYGYGAGRRIFELDHVKFGIVICHEGWRYPETVRWAARRGAEIVFHPHFHEASEGGYAPSSSPTPKTPFLRKACSAAQRRMRVGS
jgi:predicted amidohydrolase